ncbi:MAG: twin-arginine translocation signal domain-containing protein [Planctomycetota bacterium]|jgi:aryl-phospho-beta-D-glucosidase BglC (GH1 family)
MTCKLTSRRAFLQTTGAVAAGVALGTAAQTTDEGKPAQTTIPRWRGFNLVNFFLAFGRGERSAGMVSEDDLKWIRDWGFDFIRMPMDYWLWIDTNWRETRMLSPDDMYQIKESMMEKVDRR